MAAAARQFVNPPDSRILATPEKLLYLNLAQHSKFAGLQSFVLQKTDRHAAELDHRVADVIEHLPDLLIAAFVERDPVPGVHLALFHQAYLGRGRSFAANRHAAFEHRYLMPARLSLDLDFVNLRRPLRAGDEVG